MSVAERDHRGAGRRLVLRYAGLQLAATVVAAGLALAFLGAGAARAVLAGGLVVAVGNVVFGWRIFAPGVAPVSILARALVAGEVLKWVWIGVALGAALGFAHLPALPLVVGMLVAQFGFWLGLALIKR